MPHLYNAEWPALNDCPTGHTGLWFDKFCDSQVAQNSEAAQKWLQNFNGRIVGDKAELKSFAGRNAQLAAYCGGTTDAFVSEARFVSGMGRSHPIGNGFAFHPTLGVPYLPGSSVKGMVRAWIEQEGVESNVIDELFGSRDRTEDSATSGRICFLDATPVEPIRLEVDIMTPHYAQWTPSRPPGDWMSPVPIPFLTAAKGTAFIFSLIPVGAKLETEDLQRIRGWLQTALLWGGVGAKTAVGYGRFYSAIRSNGVDD